MSAGTLRAGHADADADADANVNGQRTGAAVEAHGGLDFLAGGGEMGRLIRTKAWEETPLGAIETWPQSLRTAVSLCVASNFPISIAWGPQHVQIYNDGYWPICGAKHPLAMGQDYSECWASAWPAIGGAFERGCAGEASYLEDQRMFLDRNGFLEETFFTFSFSPIRDESGKVGGLFHPVTEQTARILSERRVEMLRDLAQRTGSARTMQDVYAQAMQVFAQGELDLPFVLLYRLNEAGDAAALLAQTGVAPGEMASPLLCDLTILEQSAPAPLWPIAEVMRSRTITQVDGIARWFGDAPCGPYPEAPKAAFLLPILVPGSETPDAVLIVGASPRLQLDDAYRGFFSLLASTLSSCAANARNYENESKRAALLAELDRAKTTFFSNISHEFRTPLALILGPLDDLLAGSLPAAQSEALGIMRRNAQRLLKLVNTVLDFSRLEASRTSAAAEPTDLAQATMEHASGFRPVCETAGIALTVECDAALSAVFVDRDMWEKITLNLLSNAFKFTFTGTIAVSLRAIGEEIELAVRDTGIGIAPENLPHIFERFNRVEGAHGRTHEGSGIGLALVHELARLQGGSVTVQSEAGVGSVFRVRMPLRQAGVRPGAAGTDGAMTARARSFVEEAALWLPETADMPGGDVLLPETLRALTVVPPAALPGTAAAIALAPIIVLADDNADMRAYITRILTEQGMIVRAAADGVAALAAIRHAPMPELVLTDVMMPRLDGFGLLAQIRGDGALCHLPVVMLSARAGEEASVEGLTAGADDYLVKPFSARELVARVRGNLDMARMRKRVVERELFATVFEASPAALLLIDPAGLIEMANHEAERLFGFARGGLVSMRLDRRIPEKFLAAADGGALLTGSGLEISGLRQDGSDVPFEISFNTIEVDAREMRLIALIDITERRRIETEKEAKTQALEQSNQDLESFAYIASHDLKAPLRAISHLAEWIAEEIEPGASQKARDYLQTLVGRATRLRILLDGLLAYSRVGRDAAKQEEVDVAALVGDILAMSPPPPGFTVNCARMLPRLRTHHTPLRVVLDNLISNSLKHHDRDTGQVDISMRLDNGVAEFRVTDDGPGISPKFHKRIFEIFRTLASRDSHESSGMGLAIVKKMVEVHGGTIQVESMGPARGTTFVFTWKETQP